MYLLTFEGRRRLRGRLGARGMKIWDIMDKRRKTRKARKNEGRHQESFISPAKWIPNSVSLFALTPHPCFRGLG